jgi:hypothetical protein
MPLLVKTLTNDKQVVFDRGTFDTWCVYIINGTGLRKAPHDMDYFDELKLLSYRYPQEKIYNDFVNIYNNTSKRIDPKTLALIDKLVLGYKWNDACIIEQWLTVLYAAMIAEENKAKAVLKKRIKRLGLFQLFFLNYSAYEAANYSKGKPWKELDSIMKILGF